MKQQQVKLKNKNGKYWTIYMRLTHVMLEKDHSITSPPGNVVLTSTLASPPTFSM